MASVKRPKYQPSRSISSEESMSEVVTPNVLFQEPVNPLSLHGDNMQTRM